MKNGKKAKQQYEVEGYSVNAPCIDISFDEYEADGITLDFTISKPNPNYLQELEEYNKKLHEALENRLRLERAEANQKEFAKRNEEGKINKRDYKRQQSVARTEAYLAKLKNQSE